MPISGARSGGRPKVPRFDRGVLDELAAVAQVLHGARDLPRPCDAVAVLVEHGRDVLQRRIVLGVVHLRDQVDPGAERGVFCHVVDPSPADPHRPAVAQGLLELRAGEQYGAGAGRLEHQSSLLAGLDPADSRAGTAPHMKLDITRSIPRWPGSATRLGARRLQTVSGRTCSTCTFPPSSTAHSMSCGALRWRSIFFASAATARAWSSSRHATRAARARRRAAARRRPQDRAGARPACRRVRARAVRG